MITFKTAFTKRVGYVIIVLVILASLPFLCGLYVKQELENIATWLPLPENTSVTVKNYQRGWLFSHATFTIHHKTSKPHLLEYTKDDTITLTLHTEIVHGPLLPKISKADFGIARLLFSMKITDIAGLNQATEEALLPLFADKEILSAAAFVGFTGNLGLVFNTIPIDHNSNGSLLKWEGIKGEFFVNNTVTQTHANVVINPMLLATKQGFALNFRESQFNFNVTRRQDYPWTGTQSLYIPQFYAKDITGKVLRFSHLEAAAESHLENDFINAKFSVLADSIEIAKQTVNKFNIYADFKQLSAASLVKFNSLFAMNRNLTDQQTLTLLQTASQMFALGANGTMHYKVVTAEGDMKNEIAIQFPKLEKSTFASNTIMQELLSGLQTTIHFTTTKPLLLKLLIQKKIVHENGDPEAIKAHIAQLLSQLEQSQLLILKDDVYYLDISYQQGKMVVNGHALTEEASATFLLLLMQLNL